MMNTLIIDDEMTTRHPVRPDDAGNGVHDFDAEGVDPRRADALHEREIRQKMTFAPVAPTVVRSPSADTGSLMAVILMLNEGIEGDEIEDAARTQDAPRSEGTPRTIQSPQATSETERIAWNALNQASI